MSDLRIAFKHPLPTRFEAVLFAVGSIFLIASIVSSMLFFNYYQDRIYPNITINGFDVGGMTRAEAIDTLPGQITVDTPKSVEIILSEDTTISSSSAELGIVPAYNKAIDEAYLHGRSSTWHKQLLFPLTALRNKINIDTSIDFSEQKLQKLIDITNKNLATGYPAEATLQQSGAPYTLEVDPGQSGETVDETAFKQTFTDQLTTETKTITIEPQLQTVFETLDEDQLKTATDRAKNLIDAQIIVQGPDFSITVNDQTIIDLLTFPEGWNETKIATLVDSWQETYQREPKDPVFEYNAETLEVTAFEPPQTGLQVKTAETAQLLQQTLEKLESEDTNRLTIDLQTDITQPDKPLAETNDLGINELIGFGDSEYDHSIPSRIHNVSLTSERITALIIPPGEEFSFNQSLGEVSRATGFQPAYVIKDGQTQLGDGGGVCQVSTTVFRAVLDAGLDITRRIPHSYRVSYYELNQKPGVDATVYSGNIDLRFINDTDQHILIHSEADTDELYMKTEIYGTSDGRTTEITDHEIWDYRPPLPDQYITDPSLPTGVVKQIDWAVSGVKARFTNVVKDKDGNIIREDTYTSNYRPWSAKYLVGAG